MEQKKEAVYLINDERYLHLRENGAGVGFATYNKVTGEPLESGQISEKNLPPDERNTIPAARNWYLFELSDDDRKAIQQESVKILENIPQAGIGIYHHLRLLDRYCPICCAMDNPEGVSDRSS